MKLKRMWIKWMKERKRYLRILVFTHDPFKVVFVTAFISTLLRIGGYKVWWTPIDVNCSWYTVPKRCYYSPLVYIKTNVHTGDYPIRVIVSTCCYHGPADLEHTADQTWTAHCPCFSRYQKIHIYIILHIYVILTTYRCFIWFNLSIEIRPILWSHSRGN